MVGSPHHVDLRRWVYETQFLRRCLVLGVVPERGLLPSDEPVGRYPTIHHYPEDETINPATDGATPKTPAVKNPPP